MRKYVYYILLTLIILQGCKTKEVAPLENTLGLYFPLEEGRYVIYDVTKVIYVNKVPDTSRFQIKEINKGTYTDQQGQINYRIERYKRPAIDSTWKIDSVWTVLDKKDKIVKTENNVPFIKLVYPINDKTRWDANGMNNRQINTSNNAIKLVDTTYYTDIYQSKTIAGKSFPNTIKVIQKGSNSLIDSVNAYNVYAEGIGRIYMYNISIKLCNYSDVNQCVSGQKLDGYIVTEQYFDHGKE